LDQVFWDLNISSTILVAWDTETTGVSTEKDHLVELAALAFDEDFEQRAFERLVRPPVPIPAEATKIHGITDENVAGAPESAEALTEFIEFLSWVGTPRILIAHNAAFDVGITRGECRRRRLAFPTPEIVLDSCMLAKQLLPELRSHRLEFLASHFGVTFGRLHRAAEDVRALKGVFLKLLGLAADRAATKGGGLTVAGLIDLAGGYFELGGDARARPFRLPPRIERLEALCGGEARVGIAYDRDEEYRYITPLEVKVRGFRVYIDAFCHRDGVKKSFRADRILKIGNVMEPGA
jgi:DNA polymerase III epsilon subunit family exonuclease